MERLLVDALENVEYNIKKILFIDEKTNYRLCEYGFFNGSKIKIVKIAPKKSTYLVNIGGSLLALDYFLASKVVIYG